MCEVKSFVEIGYYNKTKKNLAQQEKEVNEANNASMPFNNLKKDNNSAQRSQTRGIQFKNGLIMEQKEFSPLLRHVRSSQVVNRIFSPKTTPFEKKETSPEYACSRYN